jgi:hypothetical protein
MLVLDTGRYTITNVRYGNVAVLPDANEDTDVVSGFEEDKAGEKASLLFSPIKQPGFPY